MVMRPANVVPIPINMVTMGVHPMAIPIITRRGIGMVGIHISTNVEMPVILVTVP